MNELFIGTRFVSWAVRVDLNSLSCSEESFAHLEFHIHCQSIKSVLQNNPDQLRWPILKEVEWALRNSYKLEGE